MFATLATVLGASLLGPLLAARQRPVIPVVVGQLLAGILLGHTGLGLVDMNASPAFPVLYELGFAMLMLSAGTHLEVLSPSFRAGAARGALAAVAVAVVAVPTGFLINRLLGVGTFPLFAVLVAGSSAAVAFPILEENGVHGPSVSFLVAWIGIADAVTVVLLALVMGTSKNVGLALAGDAAIVLVGVAVIWLARQARRGVNVLAVWKKSYERGWALQLRLSLLLLLVLSAIADRTGASTLVAGFVAGMALVTLHESRRLEVQLVGLANGFLVPIFFVLLGARLDLRALAGDPAAIGLAIALAVGAMAVHLVGAAVGGRQRVATGLAATAQLGLPAAAASIGLATHSLRPSLAAAVVAAGCLTIIPAIVGGEMLAAAGARPASA